MAILHCIRFVISPSLPVSEFRIILYVISLLSHQIYSLYSLMIIHVSVAERVHPFFLLHPLTVLWHSIGAFVFMLPHKTGFCFSVSNNICLIRRKSLNLWSFLQIELNSQEIHTLKPSLWRSQKFGLAKVISSNATS